MSLKCSCAECPCGESNGYYFSQNDALQPRWNVIHGGFGNSWVPPHGGFAVDLSKLHRSSWLCPSRLWRSTDDVRSEASFPQDLQNQASKASRENHHGDCDRHASHRAQRSYGIGAGIVFSRRTRPFSFTHRTLPRSTVGTGSCRSHLPG